MLEYLEKDDSYDESVRYWDMYKEHIAFPDQFGRLIEESDKYPYVYTKLIGGVITSEMVRLGLEESLGDIDLFTKIWNEYGTILNHQDKDELIENLSYGNHGRNVHIIIMENGIVGEKVMELLRLYEKLDFEEFEKYWRRSNLNDEERKIIIDSVEGEYKVLK